MMLDMSAFSSLNIQNVKISGVFYGMFSVKTQLSYALSAYNQDSPLWMGLSCNICLPPRGNEQNLLGVKSLVCRQG